MPRPIEPRLLRARTVLCGAERLVENGALLVDGDTLVAVGPLAEVRRGAAGAAEVDLGPVLVAPGLVNAHAHLELGALRAATQGITSFERWVEALLGARAASDPTELREVRDEDARALVATGTTTVADIDSLALGPVATGGPRRLVQRELLDARDPARRVAALEAFASPPALGPLEREGVSPHAPFSVSRALLEAIAPRVSGAGLPLAMHWAETRDEVAWCDGATAWFDRYFPRERGLHGLDALEGAGLLGPRTALIHGNYPRAGEPERIAAAGAVVVHCPGSHTWFEREPFPKQRFADAGCVLALGTDSAASNAALDMRRELALAVGSGDWTPAEAWEAATAGAARALGLEGRVGRLAAGYWADLAVFSHSSETLDDACDWLTGSIPAVRSVWIGGREVSSGEPG